MRCITLILISASLFLVVANLGGADIAAPPPESTSQASLALERYFSRIPQKIRFSSVIEYTQFDAAGKPSVDYPLGFVTKGQFCYMQDGFRYRILDRAGMGLNPRHSIVAYDGSRYQRLRFTDSELYITENVAFAKRPSEYFLRWANASILPWEFASSKLKEADFGGDLELWDLKEKAT